MPTVNLRSFIAFVAIFLSLSALGQTTTPPAATGAARPTASMPSPVSEAIRERVDHLRYEREHDARDHQVRGANIVAADGVARFYEADQFQPRWQDPARLDQLIAAIADLQYDGLDPADYHVAALQSFRSDLRGGKSLVPTDQADLELVATDAMMLALYHLYVGKVDPEKLSSQWNFSARPLDVEAGLERFRQALAAGEIEESFERARPQHPWYQRGRERLKEYRALEAAGGWSPISTGPTMRAGDE